MAVQDVTDVYANVMDFGDPLVVGHQDKESTAAVQAAIATGKHVLFPLGSYTVYATINFSNPDQKVTFLAGAHLQPATRDVYITITGARQTFRGLAILPRDDGSRSGVAWPVLLIDGADDLLLEDLYIDTGVPEATMVQISNTVNCRIMGGILQGHDQSGTTGLLIAQGADHVGVFGLSVVDVALGVSVVASTRSLTFMDCDFQFPHPDAIQISGTVEGLTMGGCHFEGGSDAAPKTVNSIHVTPTGAVQGGSILGCLFGSQMGGRLEHPRVFKIEGAFDGVQVSGCWHDGYFLAPGTDYAVDCYIWEIAKGATVYQTADCFNAWERMNGLATGKAQAKLVSINGLGSLYESPNSGVTFQAKAVQFNTSRMGFFGGTPVTRGSAYTMVRPGASRTLTHGNVETVLANLIQDLADLGLIDCTVMGAPSRAPRAP